MAVVSYHKYIGELWEDRLGDNDRAVEAELVAKGGKRQNFSGRRTATSR